MKPSAPVALLVLVSGLAAAAEYKPMTGQYAITRPTLLDAPADETPDRIVLFLEGAAARDTYRRMSAAARPRECSQDVALTKTAGATACRFDTTEDTYVCWIGVHLHSGQGVQLDVPC